MAKSDERVGLVNVILASALGVVVFVAMLVFGVHGLDPSVWQETAVVSGLRPPTTPFPGSWRLLVGWLFPVFGIKPAIALLSVVGAGLAGLCVAHCYLIARYILALVIRTEDHYPIWSRFIAPFFSCVAALSIGFSAPLWSAARNCSPAEIRFVLFVAIVYRSMRWFSIGGLGRLCTIFAAMGVLAAETPVAFLLPFIFAFAYRSVWKCVMDGLFEWPENLPEADELPRWTMFFLFVGFLGATIWVNVTTFCAYGGLEANGWQYSDIYFRYVIGYWHSLTGAATLVGWMLGIIFAVLPLALALKIAPLLVRDDRSMPFNIGVVMFLLGVFGLMQTEVFPAARFWTFSGGGLVSSEFLLACFVFCAAITLALSMAAFAFSCQAPYRLPTQPKPRLWIRFVVPALGVLFVFLMTRQLPRPHEVEMQRIVDDAVEEIVRECGDAKWIFTDGHLDAALEIAAAVQGKTLYALNMMSGASEWEKSIRSRGLKEGTADWEMAQKGVPVLLRVWATEKPGGLDQSAIQLGFEIWKRARKTLPTMTGFLARTKGLTDEDARRGIEAAKKLAERILTVSKGRREGVAPQALDRALSAVNWRISRFARQREEYELAEELDQSNTILKKMISVVESERLRTFMQMTPREGLNIALGRADFTEARRYSAIVLENDPDDVQANFGMGMSELLAKKYESACEYLGKCLKARPRDPALLNNLSIAYRHRAKFKEALDFARRAHEILPDNAEIRKTLAEAEKFAK